ncbi:MAG: glycosyltransferase family 2 protein [Cyanobacteriota bacterium]|nr:glycosyltransferase family 2 protein [Cyanobacteriota bacterium]
MQTAISVIIPVFNREAEIGRCLRSLLNQRFDAFEAFIVNDGSTDGTAQSIDSFGDSRFRVIHLSTNQGQCAARNIGIQAAKGALVCFLDADDEFLPQKLHCIAEFFEQRPDVDVLIDSFECITSGRDGSRVRIHSNPTLNLSAEIKSAVFDRSLWKATGAISARRDALINAGMWDESLSRRDDMDLVLRLTRASRCASTASVLWRKHSHCQSISADRKIFASSLVEIVRRHPEYTSRQQWRSGLAIDMSKHFGALLSERQYRVVLRDWQQLTRFFGLGATIHYLTLGTVLLPFQLWRGQRRPTPGA